MQTIEEFNPGKKSGRVRSSFTEMTFRKDSRTDKATWVWSGDILMDLNKYQALKMTVKTIDGGDYLFIEAGGFSTRNKPGWKSPLYVMKRQAK